MKQKFDSRMPCSWDTGNDLSARLHGTICSYKGLPVEVGWAKAKTLILYHPVTHEQIETINSDDPDFDVSSLEVGYFNALLDDHAKAKFKNEKNLVGYMSREPYKKWRQGLNNGVINYVGIDGTPSKIPNFMGGNTLSSWGVYYMLTGGYPSVDLGLKMLDSGEERQVAISKDVAIQRLDSEVNLVFYKTQNVGYMAPESRTVIVPSNERGWIVSRYLSYFDWKIK